MSIVVLTPRERQVVELVVEGLTNAEIGRRLFLAEETIKSHVRKALAKTGARNRVALAAWALRTELVR